MNRNQPQFEPEIELEAPMEPITLELHPYEAALILYIRARKFGVLRDVAFYDGLPTVIVRTEERVDLTKPDELRQILREEWLAAPRPKPG